MLLGPISKPRFNHLLIKRQMTKSLQKPKLDSYYRQPEDTSPAARQRRSRANALKTAQLKVKVRVIIVAEVFFVDSSQAYHYFEEALES